MTILLHQLWPIQQNFTVLNIDPVIKFDLDINETNKIFYSLKQQFTKSQADNFSKENTLELFETLPIILSAQTTVTSRSVVTPFDLFETIEPITSEYDTFTLLVIGIGIVAVVLFVLGIISIFILALAFLKKR